jgi:hypothetical protein
MSFGGRSVGRALGQVVTQRLLNNIRPMHGSHSDARKADAARVSRPNLKEVLLPGYAENAVIGNGHFAPGMQIMTKPFVAATLGNRIRD